MNETECDFECPGAYYDRDLLKANGPICDLNRANFDPGIQKVYTYDNFSTKVEYRAAIRSSASEYPEDCVTISIVLLTRSS